MADTEQVILCFVTYSGRRIAAQGSLQLSESEGTSSFNLFNEAKVSFNHSYEGVVCHVGVSLEKKDEFSWSTTLVVPINRTKIKWKEIAIGQSYRLCYRCQFERNDNRSAALNRPSTPKGTFNLQKSKDN